MKNMILKFSIVPICFVLIIGGALLLNQNRKKEDIKGYSDPKIAANTKIHINELKEISEGSLDADMKLDVDIKTQEEFKKYSFINNIKVPADMQPSSKYLIYVKKDINAQEYDILHDYVVNYQKKDETELINKSITIAFAEDFKPLRDYYIETDNLQESTINNTKLTIANYQDMYLVTFRYNNLNFDIETQKVTEPELIDLLSSIIKE